MPHAFRSAAHIEAENAQRKLDRLRDRWTATRDTWDDGSAEAVERRIANVDEVIALAKSIGTRLHAAAVGAEALSLLPRLEADRRELVEHRKWVTGAHWFDEHSPEGQMWLQNLGGAPDPRHYHSQEEYRDAYGLSNTLNHLNQYADPAAGDHPVPERDQRLLQAAQDFVDDQNTTDRGELLIRAQRHIEARTGSWEPGAANRAVGLFVRAVNDVVPTPTRTAAAPAVVQDFDDELMFS